MKELQSECYPKSGIMPIGELSEKAKVKIVTIRYYERLGLIPDPRQRNSEENRKYSFSYIDRLLFIKKARILGFSLKEIKNMIRMVEKRQKIPKGRLAKKVYQTMDEIDEQMHSLRCLRRELYKLLTKK